MSEPGPFDTPGRLLNAVDTAIYVGMSTKRLYNRISEGTLPNALKPIRIGKRVWRWDKLRIDEWLEAERKKAEEGKS